jgi:hypothetical protein
MSVLPAGRPLARFLPDLDDFLYDPRACLQVAPLVIGPRRMYGLAALFALPGAVLLASCAAVGKGDGERLALGIGLLVGGSVWLLWSLLMRGHSLVLHPDGVEVKYQDTVVWCPWALFNVAGEPFVPEGDSPRTGLTLPVAPEAVPFVELRRHDAAVAHGAEVRGRQWVFNAADEVVLPARYEVAAGDVGRLLLQLGRRLGRELPRGMAVRSAAPAASLDAVRVEPDRWGWVTVPLTRLVFPPVCCDCGQATDTTQPFAVEARGDWLVGLLAQPVRPLELAVPVCSACQARQHADLHRGGVRGMGGGAALMLVLGAVAGHLVGADAGSMLALGMGFAAVGGILGFLLGTSASRRPPAELCRYSPSRGTVAVRFRNPDYTALVLETMQARRTPGEPGPSATGAPGR